MRKVHAACVVFQKIKYHQIMCCYLHFEFGRLENTMLPSHGQMKLIHHELGALCRKYQYQCEHVQHCTWKRRSIGREAMSNGRLKSTRSVRSFESSAAFNTATTDFANTAYFLENRPFSHTKIIQEHLKNVE
jgi:hypothetical protein